MKLQGYLKGTGKLGNIVVSRVGGETIARDYNPNVANPNTDAQVEQRAKMKLASQLAAALSPVIAMQKSGLTSSRNKFIKQNIGAIIASGDAAQISYENIQLTEGSIALPAVECVRTQEEGVQVRCVEDVTGLVKRMVYILYRKSEEGSLIFFADGICEEAGADGKFTMSFPDMDGDIVIWAFGMRDNSAAATAKYGDYGVQSGSDIARLYSNRQMNNADFTLTKTRGLTLFEGQSSSQSVPAGSAICFITAGEGGSVSGAGFVNGRKVIQIGSEVVVVATPDAGMIFDGWYDQSGSNEELVSNNATYTFSMGAQTVDLVAVFAEDPDPTHNPNYLEAPVISGNTSFEDSTQVTISGPAGATIHYTTDGTAPSATSPVYAAAITINDTTTVKAVAMKDSKVSSITTKTFTKYEDDQPFDPGQ